MRRHACILQTYSSAERPVAGARDDMASAWWPWSRRCYPTSGWRGTLPSRPTSQSGESYADWKSRPATSSGGELFKMRHQSDTAVPSLVHPGCSSSLRSSSAARSARRTCSRAGPRWATGTAGGPHAGRCAVLPRSLQCVAAACLHFFTPRHGACRRSLLATFTGWSTLRACKVRRHTARRHLCVQSQAPPCYTMQCCW